jgi:hypothetical protein
MFAEQRRPRTSVYQDSVDGSILVTALQWINASLTGRILRAKAATIPAGFSARLGDILPSPIAPVAQPDRATDF